MDSTAYLSELLNLSFPLSPIPIVLDSAKKQIDLGNHDLCQGTGPRRTAGARACASTENGRM